MASQAAAACRACCAFLQQRSQNSNLVFPSAAIRPTVDPTEQTRALIVEDVHGNHVDVNLPTVDSEGESQNSNVGFSPAAMRPTVDPTEQKPALIVEDVHGNHVDVNLATADSVRHAKVLIGAALGEKADNILVLSNHTEVGDGHPLSTLPSSVIQAIVVKNLSPQSRTEPESPFIETEQDLTLTVKTNDGKRIIVDLTTVDTVGQAKIRIGEALGRSPDAIIVHVGDGSDLEGALILSSLATTKLHVVDTTQTDPSNVDFSFISSSARLSTISVRMELTGAALDITVDPNLPVAATRQQIAMALSVGESQVTLVGPDGRKLVDADVPSELGLQELGVVQGARRLVLRPLDSDIVVSNNWWARLRFTSTLQASSSRIRMELCNAARYAPQGFTFEVADDSIENSIYCWRVYFPWPEGMYHPEDDERCELIMRIPFDYPFRPPQVHVANNIQHGILSPEGKVMMDILLDQWSPAMNLAAVAVAVHNLLNEN